MGNRNTVDPAGSEKAPETGAMEMIEPEKEEAPYAPAIGTAEDPTAGCTARAPDPVPVSGSEPPYAVPEAQVRAEVTAKLEAERALHVARFIAATGVPLHNLRKARTLLATISTMIAVGDRDGNDKKKRFQERVQAELKDQQDEIERRVAKRMKRPLPEGIALSTIVRDRRWLRDWKKKRTAVLKN